MDIPAIAPAALPLGEAQAAVLDAEQEQARPRVRVQVYDEDTGTMHDAGEVFTPAQIVDVIQRPGETVADTMTRAQADATANGQGPIAWAPVSDEAQPETDGAPWCDVCQAWHPVDNHPQRACYQPPDLAPVAVPKPRPDRPVLLHSGNYALYLTPAGEFHIVYQRTAGTHPDTGEVLAIENSPQVHFRDLPEKAANLVAAVMDRDTPLPPMLEAMIMGGKMPSMRTMMNLMKEFAGADLEQVLAEAGGNGNVPGAVE